jgi:uncharacterized protein (TIGR03083 family)
MEIAEHFATLADEGDRLIDAADHAGLDAPVPTCPDWRVRDLLAHVGGVHRWATSYVAGARTDHQPEDLAEPPADDALLPWVRDGHRALVEALRRADPALECWTFLAAPSPLAFWARRQAHETTVHRVDAEAARGAAPWPVAPGFAADGIDELLAGFFGRARGRLVADPPVTVGVHALDTGDRWTIAIRPDGRGVRRDVADGDCVVSGDAADLYLFLWNRRPGEGIRVDGDGGALALWREKARVVWG